MLNKTCLLTIWCCLSLCVCSARTWTNTAGKTIDAELVKVQGGKAYLKIDQRVIPLPISGLSKKDQSYIKNWITEKKLARLSGELAGMEKQAEDAITSRIKNMPTTSIDTGATDAEHPVSLEHLKRTVKEIQRRKGDSTDGQIQSAINNLNTYRFICGLDYAVKIDEGYNQICAAAAEICNTLGKLTHGPENPGWEEARYQEARKGCGRSNLAVGSSVSGSVHMYMNDSDPGNISRLGHRRWCLNPRMGKTGFGSNGRFSAMWSMDGSHSDQTELDFIAFPTRGYMPTSYFKRHYAWSVTLRKHAYKFPDKLSAENVKVYKLRGNEARPRPGDAPLKLNYFGYNRSGFGIPCCIIFRPDDIEVDHGDRYWVSIDGIEKKNGINTEIEYLVDFTRI